MRGATLFLASIILVTRTGRTYVEQFVDTISLRLAHESAFSQIVLGLVVIVAALLLVILRDGKTEQSQVYYVLRETRGADVIEAPQIVRNRVGWFVRLRRLFFRQASVRVS